MPSPRAILRLRRLLLLLLVALVAGVGLLYWFGRAGQIRPPRTEEDPRALPATDVTFQGKDFNYDYWDKGRKIFNVRGKNIRADRSNRVELEEISVSILAPSGESYLVEGKQGTYNSSTSESSLEAGVVVRSPSGLELATSKLQVGSKAEGLRVPEPLTFRFLQKLEGRGDRLRADLEQRVFILAGNVSIWNGPDSPGPFRLDTQRLFLDRSRHQARADGDTTLSFLNHRLRTRRISLWLSEDDADVRFVRALRGVQGEMGPTVSSEQLGPMRFSGEALTAFFDADGKELSRVELEGRGDRPALLLSQSPGEPPRRLGAAFFGGNLQGGALTRVDALGGVKLAELSALPPEAEWSAAGDEKGDLESASATEEEGDRPGPTPDQSAALDGTAVLDSYDESALRLVTGRRAESLFGPEGKLTEVTVYEDVELRDRNFRASGDMARFDFGNGIAEITGKPVRALSDRGDIEAPRVLYTQRTGLMVALGGTRTRIPRGPAEGLLGGSVLSGTASPLWVEAEEAFFRDASRSFLFRGKVRAWRGENLILADELKGEEQSGQLTATGSVRTLWRPEPEAPGTQTAKGVGGQEPLEVRSGTMTYGRGSRQLVYTQTVRAQQGSHGLECERLVAELDEQQKIRALLLEEQVLIRDLATGRTVTGDRARYEPGTKTVVVEGAKVVLKDHAGTEVSGRRVIYDLGTGKAQVTSGDDGGDGDPR